MFMQFEAEVINGLKAELQGNHLLNVLGIELRKNQMISKNGGGAFVALVCSGKAGTQVVATNY